jgi:four helix bundle protein
MGHGRPDVSRPDEVRGFTDLRVYQMLCDLHIEVCELSRAFPRFEMYELGSQIRRSSNSIPANVAEGSGNKHLTIYLECLNRALGELRETLHHLSIAHRKAYLSEEDYRRLTSEYERCARMLKSLERSLLARLHPPVP